MNQFLKLLTQTDGTSGAESQVCDLLESKLDGHFEYKIDRLGNIFVHSGGYFPNDIKLMITAHMDEVALMVTHITKDGYLKFRSVGGIDERILPGKVVRIGNKKILGVIGSLAIHLQGKAERETPTKMQDLCIDIGAADQAQAENYVSVGDLAYFTSSSEDMGECIKAKALDDRVGCAVLLDTLYEMPDANFTAVFTTREEVGCQGAVAAAELVRPKYAIILEATTASDVGETDAADEVCTLGKGPVLSFMDHACIYDKNFLSLAQKIAQDNAIPYQLKRAVAGGNEAGRIQQTACGCHVLAISLPCRYIHGPVCVADERDMEAMKQLLKAIVEHLK